MKNKKPVIIGLLFALFVATACSPSEKAIETAIAMTALARPSATPASTPTPAHTPTPSCSELVVEAIEETEPHLREWDDAYEIANSTGRGNLSGPVSELQSIRRDTLAVEFPPCGEWRRDRVVGYMDFVIDAFLEFMAENDGLAAYNLALADAARTGVTDALDPAASRRNTIAVHYVVMLTTNRATVEYIAANGTDSGTVPVREFPWMLEFIDFSADRASITIDRSSPSGVVYCAIFVNGDLVDEESGTTSATCETLTN